MCVLNDLTVRIFEFGSFLVKISTVASCYKMLVYNAN